MTLSNGARTLHLSPAARCGAENVPDRYQWSPSSKPRDVSRHSVVKGHHSERQFDLRALKTGAGNLSGSEAVLIKSHSASSDALFSPRGLRLPGAVVMKNVSGVNMASGANVLVFEKCCGVVVWLLKIMVNPGSCNIAATRQTL